MADNTEKKKSTSRDRLAERYRKAKPDLNWDEEQDIDAMAADELDAFDKDIESRRAMDTKMNDLFNSDERASRIFVGWANGQDPIENLIELYGDDLIEALKSPEGKEKFKEALDKWRKGKKADEEHTAAYDKNIEQSVQNLIQFADTHNLDDAQMKELADNVHKIGSDVLEGLYTPEVLDMVYKAGNYDTAVSEAREEGRVTGKNENIRRELRKSKPATGLPPTAGQQEIVGLEASPDRRRNGTLAMFGGIPIKKQ